MDFQPWIGLLALLIAIVGAYYQRRQTKIMESQVMATPADISHNHGKPITIHWWKTPLIPVLLVLVILAWVPYFLAKVAPIDIVQNWGVGNDGAWVSVDSNRVATLRNDDKLILLIRVPLADIDSVTDTRIGKSTEYSITGGEQLLVAKIPSQLGIGLPIGDYYLELDAAVIPSKFGVDAVSSLADIQKIGGKTVGMRLVGPTLHIRPSP